MKPNEELLLRATRAYERGRWLKGLRMAALVAPMLVVSFGCCGRPSASVLLAGALAALAAVLVWRGGSAARAVAPGFAAGMLPLAIPLLVSSACDCSATPRAIPLAACIVGGLASGAILVWRASREPEDKLSFVMAGGTITALAGSLGCVVVGLGGVLAMAVGLAMVTPLALRNARATG